ncbi:ExbD/TolR family protein [Shewanella cyperi]|uniref:Biopolymer transporter ExbD n=1 Tax=Shewanella cyperi TaxID=2814292 RepID=A0A975ALU2_9GAMM|nr:biopolymer transporter ExbD [Shewanella cyperi]QSX30588.1 biopolymer transporter ExbD [Shewanella cyperi]QSX41367.1 biopolymer transporter ExbD [Shewanella cyperi]
MAFKKYLRTKDDLVVDMTPMLDIVFILLIFFIITSAFVDTSGFDYNKSRQSLFSKEKSSVISISVSKAGLVRMKGRLIDIQSVTANTQSMLADMPGASVVIEAERETLHGVVIQVLDNVKMAGVSRVSISESME